MSTFNYPSSKQSEARDRIFGVEIKDPYRWLENPDSEETKAWVEAQNKLTFGYLSQLEIREKLKDRITKLWNYEKFSVPFKEGNRYFYFKNDGLQNQSVLYTLESLSAEPKVLLDPNKLSEDGTVALSGLAISDDGKLMAYGLSTAGSDWIEYQVKDVWQSILSGSNFLVHPGQKIIKVSFTVVTMNLMKQPN
jgi:prolyl oligopeptidase